MVCILLLIVLLLSIGLVKKDNKTILVPFNLQDKLSISRNKVQNDYLVNVSSNVITTILNLTPNNVEYAEKTILNHTNSKSYGVLKNQFRIIKNNIISRKITTAFYPLSIYPNEESLTVQVEGILNSYLGQREVSSEKKKFEIKYDYSFGKLSIVGFTELMEDRNK